MAQIALTSFTGLQPRLNAESLPDNAAKAAVNCNFNSGAIEGVKEAVEYAGYIAAAPIKGGFVHVDKNGNRRVFDFPYTVNAVRSPVITDEYQRFYWTSSNGFKYSLATEYPNNYIGPVLPNETYNVGVVNSSQWDKKPGSLGITFQVQRRGVYTQLADLSNISASIWLADNAGRLVYELPGTDYTWGWIESSEQGKWPLSGLYINLNKSIDSYNQITGPGNAIYTVKQNVYVAASETSGSALANVFYLNGVPKYVQLVSALNVDPSLYGSYQTPAYILGDTIYENADSFSSGTEYLGVFTLMSSTTLSADGSPFPSQLSASNLAINQAVVQEPILAFKMEFTYQNARYKVIIYEGDLAMSGFADINGGLRGSIIRNSTTSFTLYIQFGYELGPEVRSYIFTFVNKLGEESEPSEPFELILDPGKEQAVLVVDMDDFAAVVNDTNLLANHYPLHGVRVYRTAASSKGTAEFLYAFTIKGLSDSQKLPGDTYIEEYYTLHPGNVFHVPDIIPSDRLGAACPTMKYIRNTSELQSLRGLTTIHNNMLAAFKDNEVWVSEPGKPWAWRNDAIHTVPHKVVAIAPIEQGFYVLTEGAPYYSSGNTPESLAGQRLLLDAPCVDARAWASVGGRIVYLSPEGAVVLNGLNAEVLPSFSRETWQAQVLSRATNGVGCAAYAHRVLVYFPETTNKGYMYDDEDKTWTEIDQRIDCAIYVPPGLFGYAHNSGLLFSDGGTKWKFFAYGENTKIWQWESKIFHLRKPQNFGMIELFGEGELNFNLYADGQERFEKTGITLQNSGVKIRLPSGFKAKKWWFKLVASQQNTKLTGVHLADTGISLQEL